MTYLSLFAALYAALFLLSSPGWLDFGDRWGRAFYWNLAATQSQNHLYTQKLCCGYGKQTLGWYYMTTHLLSIERADWPKLHYMFKARDANAWQREFQVGFPVEVSALNSLFVNIFHGVVARWKADAWSKQNMSCWSVNSFDFALEKLHCTEALVQFFARANRTRELTDQQDMFFYMSVMAPQNTIDSTDLSHACYRLSTSKFRIAGPLWGIHRWPMDSLTKDQ